MVCSYLDGKIRQCLLSLEDLQSCRYSHCGLVSRLEHKVLSSLKPKPTPFVSPPSSLSHILDKEPPAWSFYTENLYKLHLSDHSVPVLAAAAKSCSLSGNSTVACNKSSYISKIVSHFISQRCQLVSLSSSKELSFRAFVDFTEQIYGPAVAASLREPPFALASLVNRSCNASILLWSNEPVDELMRHLRTVGP
jgi:hypothetical protein